MKLVIGVHDIGEGNWKSTLEKEIEELTIYELL